MLPSSSSELPLPSQPLPPPGPTLPFAAGNADLRNHLEARFGPGAATADERSKLAVDVSLWRGMVVGGWGGG